MVETFICPEVYVPNSIRNKINKNVNLLNNTSVTAAFSKKYKKENEQNDVPNYTAGFFSKKNKKENEQNIMTKNEIKNIYSEIKELSATALIGSAKLRYKEDKLTKLGALPVKQQKMPFKMRLGLNHARKKRLSIALENAKVSGVILASTKKSSKSKRVDTLDKSNPSINNCTRGGVMRISKKLLESH